MADRGAGQGQGLGSADGGGVGDSRGASAAGAGVASSSSGQAGQGVGVGTSNAGGSGSGPGPRFSYPDLYTLYGTLAAEQSQQQEQQNPFFGLLESFRRRFPGLHPLPYPQMAPPSSDYMQAQIGGTGTGTAAMATGSGVGHGSQSRGGLSDSYQLPPGYPSGPVAYRPDFYENQQNPAMAHHSTSSSPGVAPTASLPDFSTFGQNKSMIFGRKSEAPAPTPTPPAQAGEQEQEEDIDVEGDGDEELKTDDNNAKAPQDPHHSSTAAASNEETSTPKAPPTPGERHSLRARRKREVFDPSAPKVPATPTGSARSSQSQSDSDGASTSSAAPGSTPRTPRNKIELLRCLGCQIYVRNKLKFRTCSECLEIYCFECSYIEQSKFECAQEPKGSLASGMLRWKCAGSTCGHINEDFVSAERLMAHRQREGTVNVQARKRTRSRRDCGEGSWLMEGRSRPRPKSSAKGSGSGSTTSKAAKWLKSGMDNASLIPNSPPTPPPPPSDNRRSLSARAARIDRIAFLDDDADAEDDMDDECEKEGDGQEEKNETVAENGPPTAPTPPALAAPQGDVMHWTRDDVRAFWISHGLEKQAEKFYKEEFDGQAMLLLTHHDIISGLGFSYASAIKVREHVLKLQNNSIVGVAGSTPRKCITFKKCSRCGHCEPN